MSDNLDTLRKRAELPNALHGCTSNPCGSVVCQTARDRDELLSRLEQAEQAVQRVREVHRPVSDPFGVSCAACIGDSRRSPYPCATIRALDGDGRG